MPKCPLFWMEAPQLCCLVQERVHTGFQGSLIHLVLTPRGGGYHLFHSFLFNTDDTTD